MWKYLILIAIAAYGVWRWRWARHLQRGQPMMQDLQQCRRCARYFPPRSAIPCSDPLCPRKP
ncbi:MAG: hypothetical protein PHO57_04355 [Acidithiobacillus sp.]|nr:hypothetical protein [Acidithiobacillus sp.]